MTTVFYIVIAGLLISLVLVTYRLLRGPTIPDRALAGDMMAIIVVALIGVYSMMSDQPILLDLIIVTAIVGFISLAVVGVYIERAVAGKARIEPGD